MVLKVFKKQLIRQKQLVSDASAWYGLSNRYSSLWVAEATPAKGQTLDAVQKGLLSESFCKMFSFVYQLWALHEHL